MNETQAAAKSFAARIKGFAFAYLLELDAWLQDPPPKRATRVSIGFDLFASSVLAIAEADFDAWVARLSRRGWVFPDEKRFVLFQVACARQYDAGLAARCAPERGPRRPRVGS